jgi:hypothetical protein
VVNSKTKNDSNGSSRCNGFSIIITISLITLFLVGCHPNLCFFLQRLRHYQFVVIDDHNPDPGIGKYNVGVVPTSWKFNFRDGSHPIQEIRLLNTTPYFWGSTGNIDWKSNVTIKNKDGGNEYNWLAQFAIFAIPHSFMGYQSSQTMRGGPTKPKTIPQSFTREGLKGFTNATVALFGWRFGFWGEEHSIAKIGIRLTDVSYNSETGTVTWNVTNAFSDGDGNDEYYWGYQYLVIGLNKKTQSSDHTTTDSPINSQHCNNHAYLPSQWGLFDNLLIDPISEPKDVDIISHQYEHNIKLPQGWYYELPQGSFDVENSNSGTGFITCGPPLGNAEDITRIAFNKDASKSFYNDFTDDYPSMAPHVLACGIEFGPYYLKCVMGCHDENGCYNYQQDSPEFWYEVPKFDLDFVNICWDGGDINYYPPDSWLNNGAGWHCNCDNFYDEQKWITTITPEQ